MNEEINFQKWLLTFRRRKLLIWSCGAAMALIGAVAIVAWAPPRYTAEAVIIIDPRKTDVTTYTPVVSNLSPENLIAAVRSEVKAFRSPALAGQVVGRLKLDENPIFTRPSLGAALRGFVHRFVPGVDAGRQDNVAVEQLLHHLTVENDGRSYAIEVRYTAPDPDLAAQIANAYAEIYLTDQAEAKTRTTKQAGEWLDGEVVSLRRTVRQMDARVQDFIAHHDLVEVKGTTLIAQQVADLNARLIDAQTGRASKEAAYEQLVHGTGHGLDSGSIVLASPLIQQLRERETLALQRRAELAEIFGPKSPQMLEANAALSDVRAKIEAETDKVANSLKGDVAVAQRRETAVRDQLASLEDKLVLVDSERMQLRDLQREADAYHGVYQDMLIRANQVLAEQGISQPDARLASSALPPSGQAFPQKPVLVLAWVAASFGFAFLLALWREWREPVLGTYTELEAAGLTPLGVVGLIRPGEATLYAEAVDATKTAIRGASSHPRTILITSSVSQEGKSLFALSLAQRLVAGGHRSLLVDCDLRRPQVAALMKVEAQAGDGLVRLVRHKEAVPVWRDRRSGIDFVPATTAASPQSILEAREFREFLGRMKTAYDYVILDAPPVVPVSDAVILSRLCDATVFVVRWRHTPRAVVAAALACFKGSNVIGGVLTQADLRRHALYQFGRSKYARYKSAYG
jgi:polysaccharide biosynthesis transport protein